MSSGWAAWPEVGEMMYFGLLLDDEDVVGSLPPSECWGLLMPTPDVEGGRALGIGL